jgi:hypothetical protein
MLRVRVSRELVVHIIILDGIDEVLDKDSINRVPREVVKRVVLGHHLCFGLLVI